MSQSLSKVYVHVVFSTKYRQPFIDDAVKERLWSYMGVICKRLDCNPVQIGGYNDHVHMLCLLSRKVAQADLVEEVKTRSSRWIKTLGEAYADFQWQSGYGIFSVNPTQVDRVTRYIMAQEEHHGKQTFKEELLTFLEKYEVEYDDQYVWD
jgi:REP element-mobilizing transposase RayT